MRVLAARPTSASTARTRLPSLYSGEEGDPSKCPFFGGPNGGGIGDANIATGVLFVLVVVLMRLAILRFFSYGPRRVLALLTMMLPRAAAAATAPQAYCNVAMDTGRIPTLPSSTTLVQVQVFIRHGSRTKASVSSPPHWPGEDDATYSCSEALVEAPDADLPDGEVLFRKSYARGRNQLKGNCALGQLVEDGVQYRAGLDGQRGELRLAWKSHRIVRPIDRPKDLGNGPYDHRTTRGRLGRRGLGCCGRVG